MKLRPSIVSPATTLSEAKGLLPNFSDALSLPERVSTIDLGVTGPISQWNTSFLFEYDVFPSFIMRHDTEWTTANRKMRVGDIILQRALIPPIGFGICMEFAVRIYSVIIEDKRLGFGYETLCGHVERGISEFYFEDRGHSIAFTIHTHSEPGHWASHFAEKLVTLPYQAWCTRQALKHVRNRFHQNNEAAD